MTRSINVLGPGPLSPHAERLLTRNFNFCRLADQANPEEFLARHGSDFVAAAVSAGAGFPDALWARLPSLRLVAVHGVGTDKIDLAKAQSLGVTVTTTPDILADDVADLAIGMWIALSRKIVPADHYVRSGQWRSGAAFALSRRVTGQRVGIVGLGRIGAAIARRCAPFTDKISYTSSRPRPSAPYAFFDSPASLAGQSDVLFAAVPGGSATQSLIDRDVLAALGPAGMLINVARGTVVDEEALIDALKARKIAGAALDVFRGEPDINPAFFELDNVLLQPHLGSATEETRMRMAEILSDQIQNHFGPEPA